MDMDNSLGDIFSTASTANVDADAPPSPIYGTFEAEFWRSFAEEHQLFEAPQMPFDASDASGLWSGHFVPPPPRPPFMAGDESVISDGLTTCDLCTWAVHEKNAFSMEGSFEAAGELGWAFSIGLVSVVSALIGAIIMITLVRCKRLKSNSSQHMNAHHLHHNHTGLHHHRHQHHADHLDHHHMHHHQHQHLHSTHPHHAQHAGHERGLHIGGGGGGGHHHHHPQAILHPGAAGGLLNSSGSAASAHGNGGAAIGIGVDTPTGNGGNTLLPWWCRKPTSDPHANEHHTMHAQKLGRTAEELPASASNPQVWIWLKTVNTPPTPEPIPMFPPSASIENYYTNTDDGCIGSGACKVTEVVYEEIAGVG